MTFLEQSFDSDQGDCGTVTTTEMTVSSASKNPEMPAGGACGITDCECPGLVEGYEGYCRSCGHSASQHW